MPLAIEQAQKGRQCRIAKYSPAPKWRRSRRERRRQRRGRFQPLMAGCCLRVLRSLNGDVDFISKKNKISSPLITALSPFSATRCDLAESFQTERWRGWGDENIEPGRGGAYRN